MGNKLDYQQRWLDVKFTHTRLPDVNDFCKEIQVYNVKINKIRDALLAAEDNLILYLGLEDIETLKPLQNHNDHQDNIRNLVDHVNNKNPLNMRDVTLAIFFSFNAYFRGEFVKMLNLKLSSEPPFFEINIHYLNPILKDIWLQYQKYMTTLENTNSFCQALMKKYRAFYQDYYERYTEFLMELENQRDLDQIDKLNENYEQIVRVGQNLGCVDKQIQDKYNLILDAIDIIREGTEITQTAVVCRVNKIKYPDECLAKILQLKNVPQQEVYDQIEYKHNQQRNYERYLFVSNKYMPVKSKEPQEVYDEREYEDFLEEQWRQKQRQSGTLLKGGRSNNRVMDIGFGNQSQGGPNSKYNNDEVIDLTKQQNQINYSPNKQERQITTKLSNAKPKTNEEIARMFNNNQTQMLNNNNSQSYANPKPLKKQGFFKQLFS
eukprot:403336749